MADFIESPDVLTTIRIGGFSILAYAYRPLTRSECVAVRNMYLQQTRRKTLPKSGSVKIITQFGNNPTDDL